MLQDKASNSNDFDIRNYTDYLTKAKGGKYICPNCGGNDLSISKQTGKFQCWSGCGDTKAIYRKIKDLAGGWNDRAVTKESSPTGFNRESSSVTSDTLLVFTTLDATSYDYRFCQAVLDARMKGKVKLISYIPDLDQMKNSVGYAFECHKADKVIWVGSKDDISIDDSSTPWMTALMATEELGGKLIYINPLEVGLEETSNPSNIHKILTPDFNFTEFGEQLSKAVLNNQAYADSSGNPLAVPVGRRYKTVKELFTQLEGNPIEWLIPDYIAVGQFTVLAGDSGVGKSILCYQLAKSITTGCDWLGIKPDVTGKVLILSMEESSNLTVTKLRDDFSFSEDNENLYVQTSDDYWSFEQLSELDSALEDIKPQLLIIDSLRAIKGKIEENKSEVQKIIDALRKLGQKYNCAVILLHHIAKLTGGYSGHTSIKSGADELWLLTANKNQRTLTPEKGRIGTRNVINYGVADDGIGFVNPVVMSPSGGKVTHPNQKQSLVSKILTLLKDSPGMTAKDIAEALNESKDGTIKATLSRLVSQGKLDSCSMPDDSKQKIYGLNSQLTININKFSLEGDNLLIENFQEPEPLPSESPAQLTSQLTTDNTVLIDPPVLIDNRVVREDNVVRDEEEIKPPSWTGKPQPLPDSVLYGDLPYPMGTKLRHIPNNVPCTLEGGTSRYAFVRGLDRDGVETIEEIDWDELEPIVS